MHALSGIDRHTQWQLVERLQLNFQTFHPQGLAFGAGLTFLSSVEVLERPRASAETTGSAQQPGVSGVGHVFVLDDRGGLLRDIILGEGEMYHPGGIDFDGSAVWMPLAEYHPGGQSIIYTVDPESFEIRERFRVADHISWVVSDRDTGLIYGGSWGSRSLYTWTTDGSELSRWENPSDFIDYQDCRHVGGGLIVCSGIAVLPGASGPFELGGLAAIDAAQHRIIREFPLPLYSEAGHVVTRNPFSVTIDEGVLTMWVAPDDGDEGRGTGILRYRPATAN